MFLSYINAVETRGTGVLKPLIDQGKKKSDPPGVTGWTSVAETLDSFLRVSMRAMEDAGAASCREDMELSKTSPPLSSAKQESKRKADSGYVSFGAGGRSRAGTITTPTLKSTDNNATDVATSGLVRTSNNENTASNRASATSTTSNGDKNKPLPSTPAGATTFASPLHAGGTGGAVRNFSRLEKIALEIRKIKGKKTPTRETDEVTTDGGKDCSPGPIEHNPGSAPPRAAVDRGRPSAMNRFRSFGDLKSYSRSKARSKSRSRPETPQPLEDQHRQEGFNVQEMQRQRALFEAREERAV